MSNDRGPWFQTFTGKTFYPMDPRPEDICIQDIAHQLALKCRFGGACRTHYSVAQHSVTVSRYLPDRLKKRGLMHDADEAYMPDFITGTKPLFPGAVEMAAAIMECVAVKFDLEPLTPEDKAIIKDIDRRLLVTEARELMSRPEKRWEDIPGNPIDIPINPFPWHIAKIQFLDTFEHLFHE